MEVANSLPDIAKGRLITAVAALTGRNFEDGFDDDPMLDGSATPVGDSVPNEADQRARIVESLAPALSPDRQRRLDQLEGWQVASNIMGRGSFLPPPEFTIATPDRT
eukprot:511263-Alexandrium_andersonii.AAC.1